MGRKLPESFFLRPDVVRVARGLLGCALMVRAGPGGPCGGIIAETEAYGGVGDRASHAYGNRRTRRTEVMFRRGGVAYVYLCYGLHALFNIVTNREGVPDAVLIRALIPVRGIERLRRRRGRACRGQVLLSGPGVLTRALGIGLRHNGISLLGDVIWLEEGVAVRPSRIVAGPRIGVEYAGADARRPWRFRLREEAALGQA